MRKKMIIGLVFLVLIASSLAFEMIKGEKIYTKEERPREIGALWRDSNSVYNDTFEVIENKVKGTGIRISVVKVGRESEQMKIDRQVMNDTYHNSINKSNCENNLTVKIEDIQRNTKYWEVDKTLRQQAIDELKREGNICF